MCDCFHLAFPNWHHASSGTGARHTAAEGGRRLRAPEPATDDDSICEEPSTFTDGERPRPQGSSPVEDYPESAKYTDKECEAEHDPHHKSGSGHKAKKSGLGSMFERRSTPKMSKLKEVPSPEAEVIVKTARDGCAEGLVYGGGKEGIFIKEVVPESPASKSLKVKEGDQLLSATVYFDNVSYEDAIQILEHAQAYKVKLCLKRKPDITEMEPAIESDVIHEEDMYPTEGREQGKTKRRGDARISWPKFPSFGKGRKSRFTRSHSSSEADEQRKLELSPPTSDTESPIKSQDALKGKKKHKIKLSGLTKRGRISSSEDQDTDVPAGQISGDIHLTQESDMLSPESLEGPSGEMVEVNVTEDLKVEEDLRPEQINQTLTDAPSVQHKVELISIDSTLKTTDLTVALADQVSPSDGKKKKKEKSELKVKILGKDKSHKKDAKPKASPKRLKALGASIEKEEQLQTEKSDVVSSFESHANKPGDQAALDASVTKQPATEDVKTKEDPYDRLSKSRVSTTQLPKREDIEIPGMEDMTKVKAATDIPESKTDFTGHSDESQSETVQLLIDVNSVKEAVSKLPGYKLPQVDTSGVPILEEITVIDANAQRISVKTPTKVVETKAKHEAQSTGFDITASPEISKIKVPKIMAADLTSEEHLTETKTEKEHETKAKEGHKEAKTEAPQAESTLQDKTNRADEYESAAEKELTKKSKRTKITMPSFGITTPDIIIPEIGIDLPKQNISLQKGFQSKTELKKGKMQPGEAVCDVKLLENTEDLTEEAAAISVPGDRGGEKDVDAVGESKAAPSDAEENVTSGEKDVYTEAKTLEREVKGSKFKLPHLSISVPKVKGIKTDLSTKKKEVLDTAEVQLPEALEVEEVVGSEAVCISEQKLEAEAPDFESQGELDGQGSKLKRSKFGIKLPKLKGPEFDLSLSRKDGDVKLPDANAEIHQAERMDVSVPEEKMDADKPEGEAKPLSVEGELDGHGSKLKMPKFGIKIPKIKSSDFELSLSSKDRGIEMPETQVCVPKAPEADDFGTVDPNISDKKTDPEKSETEIKALEAHGEIHGQGSKFKMPKFGIKMPKFKGPEFDLHFLKKDEEATLPQDEAEDPIPAEYETDVTPGKLDVPILENKMELEGPELEIKAAQAETEADLTEAKLKKPKFGIKMPKIKGPELDISLSKKAGGVTLSETKGEAQLPEIHHVDVSFGGEDVNVLEQKMGAGKPEREMKPVQAEAEADVQGGKLKKPKFGIKMPKIKGPEFDISLSKKDGGVTVSEIKSEAQLPENDVNIVSVPEPKITPEKPELKVKPVQTEGEPDGQGHKFKMPKLGISMPKVKELEVDLNLLKKDEDVTLPDANGEIKITNAEPKEFSANVEIRAPQTPDVTVGSLDVKTKAAEVDEKTSKFKMPKFGISLPKLKGPEKDSSISKRDVEISLPDVETDEKLSDVKQDGRTHEIPDVEGSASKVQMKTFEVPKLQAESPQISVEISVMDKDVNIDGAGITVPEKGFAVGVKAPSAEAEIAGSELDVKGSKFKMPHLGFTMSKVKGPKIDLSKMEAGTTLPKAKADVTLQKADLEKADVSVQKATVDIEKPELEMEALELEAPPDGEKDEIKMPKFGIKMPKVKGPEFHFGLPKKADVPTPEAKAGISLLDAEPKAPSAKAKMAAPETEAAADDTERSSSAFKMPSISFSMPKVKLPDASLSLPKREREVTLPDAEAQMEIPEVSNVEVSLGKAEVMIPEGKVEAEKPEVQIKPLQTQVTFEGQGGRFKIPKLGITMPKAKASEMDLNLSKEDTDGTLAEANAEVKMPDPEFKESSGKVEIKTPEIQDQFSHVEQTAKFKLPTLKFPTFKVAASADAPDLDKDTKIEETQFTVPADTAKVDIEGPKFDTEDQFLNGKVKGTESKGKESKFKLPKFGISLPSVQGSEKDFSISKKDVKLPKGKADVQLPKGPETNVNLGEVNVSIPEVSIEMKKPDMQKLQPEAELDRPALKFKTPTFGEAKLEGPQADFSSSKTSVPIIPPEVKAEVGFPGVDLKEASAVVEVKAAQIEPQSTGMKGSPSKFKLPKLKFPKFGVTTPNVRAEVPDIDKGIKIDGADVQTGMPSANVDVAEIKGEVHLPDVEVKAPLSTHVLGQQQDVEVDAKSKKYRFSMPKFSFSKQSIKASEVDVGFPEVEVPEGEVEVKVGGEMATEPLEIKMQKELKPEIELCLSKESEDVVLSEAEVNLPDVEVRKGIVEVEAKAPEIKMVTKTAEGSPSKFKMPTFKLQKFGLGTPTSTMEEPASDKDVHIDGTDVKIPEEVLAVTIEASGSDFEAPSIEIKTVETKLEGKGSKFKLPSLGFSVPQTKGPDVDLSQSNPDVDVTQPGVKGQVKLPDVEVKKPFVEAAEIKTVTKDSDRSSLKFKMPSFKLPKFGVGSPSATMEEPTLEKDVKLDKSDIKLPEGALAVNITAPSTDTEGPTVDLKMKENELKGKGGSFKLPSLGVSVPGLKGPDIDLDLSKTDVAVTQPESKAESQLPEAELMKVSAEVEAKAPEIKVRTKEAEGSPSKFKMPTFKLPKFGLGTPSATVVVPALDVKAEIPHELLAVNISAPDIEAEGPSVNIKTSEIEHPSEGSTYKLPTLAVSVPGVKDPNVDLSLSKTDVDVTLPEVEAEVQLPDFKLDRPSTDVEAKGPEIKIRTKEAEVSPSKFKMPTFKLPKLGLGTPSTTVEVLALDKDVTMPEEAAVTITEPCIETKDATLDIKTETDGHETKESKFKLPSLGVSVPRIKGPDVDLSLSKTDVDVALPEIQAAVQVSDVKLDKRSIDVEAKGSEIKVKTKEAEGSPSKFKMPTFKLPKFGIGASSSNEQVLALAKDVKADMPDEVLEVTISAPGIEAEGPTVDIKTSGTEHESKGSKFKLPSLGVSVPGVKGPDRDLSLSKMDVAVTLPESKTEVQLPEAELMKMSPKVEAKAPEIKVRTKEAEGSPSKFKMPTFKLPKFSVGTPSTTVEVPALDKDVATEMPEEAAVRITASSIETKDAILNIKTEKDGHETKESKFKLPSLGVSVPHVKGPDVDLSLSKTDVDVTLPEVQADVQVSDVKLDKHSINVEAKGSEFKIKTKEAEGSPSKFKMPTFKLPKFGIGAPSSSEEVKALDKDIKADMHDEVLAVTISAPGIEAEGPTVDIKTSGTEHESKGSKFKLPSLGVSVPGVKGPDIDLSLSKTDVAVTLAESKAEGQLPEGGMMKVSAEVEAKAPEIKVRTKEAEGSPSKFKMPTFKLPKFRLGTPSASVEVPALDKDVKAEIPDEVLAVTISAPDIEAEGPSVDIKPTGIEDKSEGGKFKLPSLGMSGPGVKGPSKTDVDVTLPEVQGEVQLPDVKLDKPSIDEEAKAPEIKVKTKEAEGSPSKFKMPTFKLPKFGIGAPSSSVEVPALEKDIITELPDEVLAVTISAPSTEAEDPTVDVKTTGIEHESKGSKFKLPSLGFSAPKVKGPIIDLSLKNMDVDAPPLEVEADVKLTDTELKKSSVEVKSEVPGVNIEASNIEGSPSKFRMPSFKLPKFGASVEMPDMEKNIKAEEIKTEVKLPDVEIKEPAGFVEEDIKVRKTSWTLPKFSFSKTNTKVTETDINLEDEGIQTDVHAADTDTKEASVALIDGRTTTDLDAKLKKPRFSLPKFSFSKQDTKKAEVDSSQVNVDVSLPEGKAEVKQPDITVKSPECETDLDGQESKFKIPKFGITMPKVKVVDISRKDVSTVLPDIQAEVQLPNIDIKQTSADMEIKAQAGSNESSPSKFGMLFGAATPQVSMEGPDVNKDSTRSLSVALKSIESELKTDVDTTLPETKLPTADVKEAITAVAAPEIPTTETEAQTKQPSWTFPKISFSKAGSKAPDVDVNLETQKVDVTAPETSLPDKPSEAKSVEESPAMEIDTSLKKSKFSLPRFSFSKGSSKELEVKVEAPHVAAKTEHQEIKLSGLELETRGGSQGPEVALTSSQKGVEIKADVKVSEGETGVESKSKDVKGSPIKFKMPTLKMPKFSSVSYDITSEEKVPEADQTKRKDDGSVAIKDTSTDAKTDATKAEILDSETPKTETDGAVHGSPSKFKLPSFKMPRLSFSKPKPEDVLADSECKKDQEEMEAEQKTESNSSKASLISFGEILKAIDVEFDVPKIDKVEENLETPKEVCETDETSGKHSDEKEKEMKSKQEATKSPDRTGWFKFPKFGLSSPTEPPKIPDKRQQKDEMSPEQERGDEERSPSGSVQSSDAFADISSTITSEPVGLSSSSPAKVTVKYSDPTAAVGPGEMHGDIITMRTELISDVPNLPEKITIPLSGVSSSSEDTVRLESGKIHVITSNIQATPETQHAKLLTAIQIQSAGGLDVKTEASEAASWTVGDSQSGRTTVFERHVVQETSSEKSESKETIVITKQITHVLEKSDPISGETASSIQRLKDSVHTEKMRFFDEAEK